MPDGYGFGGGFLQGVGNALVEREKRSLEQSQQQRKNLWDLHASVAGDPTATHDTKLRAMQNLARLATLKSHDKIPKELTDISQYMTPPAGYGQEAPGAPPSGFTTGSEMASPGNQDMVSVGIPHTGGGLPTVGSQFGPQAPGQSSGGSLQMPGPGFAPPQYNLTTQGTGEQMIGTSPFNAPAPPPYSGFYSPEEQAQMKAAADEQASGAKIRGEYGARAAAADQYLPKNASPEQRAAFIAGRAPQVTGFQQKAFKNKDGQVVVLGYDYHTNTYRDPDGNLADITGLEPLTAGNDANTAFELFKQSRKEEGKTDKQISDEWNTTMSQVTGLMSVQQNDGTWKAVPFERGTVTTKGGTTAPVTPPTAKVTGEGTTVGGRPDEEVKKSFVALNNAEARYDTMVKSLPAALAGDQQAMVNLLGAHIGMTIQGNSIRGTQAIWEEAMGSSPWLEKALARFTSTDPQTGEVVINIDPKAGVFLTNGQMKSMLELGKQRVETGKDAYARIQQESARGYKPETEKNPPAPMRPNAAGGAIPKKGTFVWDPQGTRFSADGTHPLPDGWTLTAPGAK